jgi:hypothetical protein
MNRQALLQTSLFWAQNRPILGTLDHSVGEAPTSIATFLLREEWQFSVK